MSDSVDKEGRELTVGARVQDSLNSDFTGTVERFRSLQTGLRVEVRLTTPQEHEGKQISYRPVGDTGRFQDLLLINSPTERTDR